jgi:hypothetical protein
MMEPEVKKMAQDQVYEGTLDEIVARYGKELAGHNLKVFVDDKPVQVNGSAKPFYETATPDEWADSLRDWATSHNPNIPLLSDEAIDRDSIYEGRGE